MYVNAKASGVWESGQIFQLPGVDSRVNSGVEWELTALVTTRIGAATATVMIMTRLSDAPPLPKIC